MKKLVIALILLAAGGGGAYYYYTYGQVKEKPQVVQTTLSQGDITEAVQATGTLEALRTVQVGSQVSGKVQELYADFNSIVKKDQLIAKIDPTLLQVQVELQQANVERQKGEIESQKVQLEDAKVQLDRTQKMFEKGLANQQQLDQAVLTEKTRATALDAAEKQLVTNQANLDQAKLNVDYTNIYAPIDGVVVNRLVDIGQTVQSSMTTPQFFVIATDLRNLKLTASVDEAEIGKIQRGMDVTFTVDSYPGTQFTGQVDAVRLNATTSNNVVTYPVWINAPNPDLKLRPSMTASLKVIISTASNVTRIPNGALRFRPTNDMYTALGLTPPAAGQGRAVGAGPAGADAGAVANPGGGRQSGRANAAPGAAAPGAPAAAPDAAGGRPRQGGDQAMAGGQGRGQGGQGFGGGQGRQPGQGGQGRQPGQAGDQGAGGQGRGQGGQGFGGGGGRGGQFANMTPEQRQQMQQQFGGRGGQGGGQGRGGRQQQQQPANQAAPPVQLNAEKIDDLFTPVQTRTTRGQVWTWDEANKKLEAIRVVTGITDGQFSQLISGDAKVGQQVVTNIVVPLTAAQRQAQQSSIFGQQQRGGGPGGFGGPGGPGGFGGPGGPAGGGGARGGGGGGGR
jgi:HlyD family secretion protein